MKLSKKTKIIVGAAVLVGVGLVVMPKSEVATTVSVANVVRDNIESTISTSGVVTAKTSRDMYPEVAVKVNAVYVEKNAGKAAGFLDKMYEEAGATILETAKEV